MNAVSIRLAQPSDLSRIVEIYNQAIRSRTATGHLQEVSIEDRQAWYEKFDENSFPLYVAEFENVVVGYGTLSPYRAGRKAMGKVAEVSFYLDYRYHGKGIDSTLLNAIIEDCKRVGKEKLLAILFASNDASIALLKKFGFVQWGLFPGIVEIDDKKIDHLILGLDLAN